MKSPPESPDQALIAIREAWVAWALKRIDEVEFAARVADALEAAGLPLISSVGEVANDEG